MKFRKKYERRNIFAEQPFLQQIMEKETFNLPLRILSYFINTNEVERDKLLEEIFGKIATDKKDLFFQKVALGLVIRQIRINYNIYIRNFVGITDKPYSKILNTKEEFIELKGKIDKRIESLEVERGHVIEISNDIEKYNQKTREILNVIKRRLDYGR